jgi:hypothetical protein
MATVKKKKSALQDMAGTVSTAIVIMIVLTIFVFPKMYGNRAGKSLPDELEAIAAALEKHRSEKGSLPIGTQREIAKALADVSLEHERKDADGLLLDPWEKALQIFTSHDGFVIRSAGKNGEFDKGAADGDDVYFGSR